MDIRKAQVGTRSGEKVSRRNKKERKGREGNLVFSYTHHSCIEYDLLKRMDEWIYIIFIEWILTLRALT